MGDRDRFADDIAAYALGALEPEEADALRAHLQVCVVCGDEFHAFEEVVETFPEKVALHPAPGHLRRRVLAEIRRGGRDAPTGRRRGRATGPTRPSTLRAAVIASVVVAAIMVAVTWGFAEHGSTSARVFPATVKPAGTSAWLRVSGDRASLRVRDLAPPSAGEIYEVWLERRDGVPRPTSALFGVTHNGGAEVVVPGSVRGVVRMIVTQEPAGGSRTPTSPPVISARLA